MSESGFTDAAGVDELPEKGFIVREVSGISLVLCQVKGDCYALENRCSHAFQTFDGGRLRGVRLMCPLHGACFDVRDGRALGLPASQPIRSYPVRVEDGRMLVGLDAG